MDKSHGGVGKMQGRVEALFIGAAKWGGTGRLMHVAARTGSTWRARAEHACMQ
jgi:hypothetical protein